ncbi:hypothetical protein [Pararhodospirillum photometricum]|nr:hypothetical protein [Pararhodospirillum photometricum]
MTVKPSLLWVIGAGVLGSVVMAVTLVMVLTALKADENLIKLSESRRVFVARQMEVKIQTGFNMGLSLASQSNLSQKVQDVAKSTSRLSSLEVFDETGAVLFAAGPQAGRSTVPEAVRKVVVALPAGHVWSGREPEGLLTALPLVNSFGQIEGGLLLISGRDALNVVSRRILQDIAIGGLGLGVVAGALGLVAVARVFSAPRQGFRRADAALSALAERHDPPFAPNPDNAVEQAVGEFRDRVTASWRALDEARQRLDTLDR